MRFDNKTIVVTGAAQGIGRAIAGRFAADGAAHVALLDIRAQDACAAAELIDPSGRVAAGYACDVSNYTQVQEVFSRIAAQHGDISILVNNAGITRDAMFHKMSEAQWDDVICVNLKSMFNCCQAVVPSMRANKYGKIVNLASVSAFGNLGQTNYGASKGGVIGFTKCLARDLARSQCNVNCIAPSYIDTPMLQAVPPETMQRFLQAIPLGRLGTPEELAGAVAFLASDDASFITGECLVVSGGSYM